MFYFGANHPLLIHNDIMSIAIRDFFNLTDYKVIKVCDVIILCKYLTKLFVFMVKELGSFLSTSDLKCCLFVWEFLISKLSNEYKRDSFVVLNKKFLKMSTKLLGCIQSWVDKLFPCLEKDRMPFSIVNYFCLMIPCQLLKNTLERSYFETKNLTLTTGACVSLMSYKKEVIIKIRYVWIILF